VATDAFDHVWGPSLSATECGRIRGARMQSTCLERPGHTGSGPCIAAGGVFATACVTTALRGAIELLGDGVGNDNGLCEAGEACEVLRNIGAYQGEGALLFVGSTAAGAAVPNVTFYQRPVLSR
jgi:hypothetical protein